MGWGEGLGGLPFPCPSPKKHRAGQGRGSTLARSFPPRGATSPSALPRGLAPGLGPAELGSGPPGYEPVNLRCVDRTFSSLGGGGCTLLFFFSGWGG